MKIFPGHRITNTSCRPLVENRQKFTYFFFLNSVPISYKL